MVCRNCGCGGMRVNRVFWWFPIARHSQGRQGCALCRHCLQKTDEATRHSSEPDVGEPEEIGPVDPGKAQQIGMIWMLWRVLEVRGMRSICSARTRRTRLRPPTPLHGTAGFDNGRRLAQPITGSLSA